MTREEHSEFVDVSVSVYDRTFDFHLCRRPVPLGQHLTVDYHWMDVSEIRQGTEAQQRDFVNLNNCISLWWHVVRQSGRQHEPEVIHIYLLALCYLLLARVKGQYRLYSDAIPRPRRYYDAPPLDNCRLSDVTSSNVSTHLHTILDGNPGSDDERQYAKMLIGWLLSWGTAKYESEGRHGRNEFLGKVEFWNASRRKRSHGLVTTRLLDELAYSSKMAFYQCYANTWVALIPKLAEHGLAPTSQSFLYCWHCPDFEERDDLNVPTPPGGVVLALHPMSAWLMNAPSLADACGEFFAELSAQSPNNPSATTPTSHQKFLNALVMAANLYKQAVDQQRERRPRRGSNIMVASNAEPATCHQLTEFLARRGERCPACGGPLTATSLQPIRSDSESATLPARCPRCPTTIEFVIGRDELISHLNE